MARTTAAPAPETTPVVEEVKKEEQTLLLKLKNPLLSFYDPETGNQWAGEKTIRTKMTQQVAKAMGGVLVETSESEG